ncbi:hypothetical protein FQR65_LT05050 [Abscondita terminalis]|nr:hypothetical protein FQR65_LT05050 [Abscondita terminalis]
MSFLLHIVLSKFHQIIFAIIIHHLIFGYTTAVPVKTKRSPLEVGLISFNNVPKFRLRKTNITKHHHRNSYKTGHYHHTWIPGHVRDHAFIPAHEEHIFIPMHEVVVTQPIVVQSSNLYRSQIGGFGIGVNFGGRGAGHGFHVSTYHF